MRDLLRRSIKKTLWQREVTIAHYEANISCHTNQSAFLAVWYQMTRLCMEKQTLKVSHMHAVIAPDRHSAKEPNRFGRQHITRSAAGLLNKRGTKWCRSYGHSQPINSDFDGIYDLTASFAFRLPRRRGGWWIEHNLASEKLRISGMVVPPPSAWGLSRFASTFPRLSVAAA